MKCEICQWRESEIGYPSPCPSHQKEVPFMKDLAPQTEEEWINEQISEIEEPELGLLDH